MIGPRGPRIKAVTRSEIDALGRQFEARLGAGPEAPGPAARVLEAAGPAAGRRALDVGCGCGGLVRALGTAGARAAGVDVCANLLGRAAASGGAFARADAHALPFPDGAFDLATSALVLHYLKWPGRALAELRRVLRPGGRLVLCDRVSSTDPRLRGEQEAIERLRNPLVRRLLSGPELEAGLAGAGFVLEASEEFEEIRPLDAWLAGVELEAAGRVLAALDGRDLGGLRRLDADRVAVRIRLIAGVAAPRKTGESPRNRVS